MTEATQRVRLPLKRTANNIKAVHQGDARLLYCSFSKNRPPLEAVDRLSLNPHTAKMQKSKPTQTKNLINKWNFTQPFLRLCESIFCLQRQPLLNVPVYVCRGGFLVCVCFSTSAACRKILFRHADRPQCTTLTAVHLQTKISALIKSGYSPAISFPFFSFCFLFSLQKILSQTAPPA